MDQAGGNRNCVGGRAVSYRRANTQNSIQRRCLLTDHLKCDSQDINPSKGTQVVTTPFYFDSTRISALQLFFLTCSLGLKPFLATPKLFASCTVCSDGYVHTTRSSFVARVCNVLGGALLEIKISENQPRPRHRFVNE